MLRRIPRGATVLDVGCWDGSMGAFLRSELAATVDGIEPDSGAAARAAVGYRRVIPATVEQALETGDLADGEYDALVFYDVLEHLGDPWSVLTACRQLLRPGGAACVSIPNVAHWSVRKSLLQGQWRYRDSGILDRTHLRFFTRSTARELLEDSGWRVDWESSSVGQPPIIRLPDDLLGHLARWPSMFAVQLLFEARPAAQGSCAGIRRQF